MRLRRTRRGIAIVADVRLRQEIADGAVGKRLDQRRRQVDRALGQTVERIVNEGLVKTGVDIAARQRVAQLIIGIGDVLHRAAAAGRDAGRGAAISSLESMADHPRSCGRKALCTAPHLVNKARRLSRTTAAARRMRSLVLVKRPWRIRAALVGGRGLAPVRRHAEEVWRRQNRARRRGRASRTPLWRIALRHWPHVGKWTAIVAEIIVDRHFISLRFGVSDNAAADAGRPIVAVPHPVAGRTYLSGESATSTPPLTCLTGPAADGMMSKSKISVGRYSVAQAFGISTTPLMWP